MDRLRSGASADDTAEVLWEPSAALRDRCALSRFAVAARAAGAPAGSEYAQLWRWSVEDLPAFWDTVWRFFDVLGTRSPDPAVVSGAMPGVTWFPGATLNYAEQALRHAGGDRPAILHRSEVRPLASLSWAELRAQVAAAAAGLRALGVGSGDRVAAYLPNIPEAVVALLACASLGAVWSSCSPDFGGPSAADRFRQIEPVVLLATDGHRYAGRDHDRRQVVMELARALPSVRQVVWVPYLGSAEQLPQSAGHMLWRDLVRHEAPLRFEPVPFAHPLWILYSSGTTGLPKPIVQSHGGIALEHLKALGLHHDLGPEDRFFWFTTTGWMMWNFLVSGLLLGASIVLYDGSPAHPDAGTLWQLAEMASVTLFGTSAGHLTAAMKAGLAPQDRFDLSRLRSIGSTGSPLSAAGFRWVYQAVKRDLWLASVSGGTDVCTGFVLGAPWLPVRAGVIQCRALGARVEAYDPDGRSVTDAVGELVVTAPMPSMPIGFWNDPDGRRYRAAYFEMFPGVWRHGDGVRIRPDGGVVVYGRSDATINRLGVRMGSSEIYRAVEALPEVTDSLVVDLERPDGQAFMPLFVVLGSGQLLDPELEARIASRIRVAVSPRHVPDRIIVVPEIPKTLNGKKLEVPVRRILQGEDPAAVLNPGSVANLAALAPFVALARQIQSPGGLAPAG